MKTFTLPYLPIIVFLLGYFAFRETRKSFEPNGSCSADTYSATAADIKKLLGRTVDDPDSFHLEIDREEESFYEISDRRACEYIECAQVDRIQRLLGFSDRPAHFVCHERSGLSGGVALYPHD